MIERLPLPIAIPGIKLLDLQRCEAIFAIIVKCADQGLRCPTAENFEYWLNFTGSGGLISKMAGAQILRVEVSNKNYRTVWVCAGPHAGKSTLQPGQPTRAYVVLGPARPKVAA